MPYKPDSRFANLPIFEAIAPDGTTRRVVALRIMKATPDGGLGRHRVIRGEEVDLLARRYYGDEGLWWRILDANPLVYPLDIGPGDVIDLPASGAATQITRARSF